jgi:hypothetical protein
MLPFSRLKIIGKVVLDSRIRGFRLFIWPPGLLSFNNSGHTDLIEMVAY